MRLIEIKATEKTAPSEVHLCQVVKVKSSNAKAATVICSFWAYDADKKANVFSEDEVTFWNNEGNPMADRVKALEIGSYIVAQIGTRKNGEKVCVNFIDKNHMMTIVSGEDEYNIFLGRPGKVTVGSKKIKGQDVKALFMTVPVKDGEKAKACPIEMLDSAKFKKVDAGYNIATKNPLIAIVCGKAYNSTYTAYKLGVPASSTATKEPEKKADAQPKSNADELGGMLLSIGSIGEQLKLTIKETYEQHKEWVEFIAYEWEPYASDLSKLDSQKKQKQACREYLQAIGVTPDKL